MAQPLDDRIAAALKTGSRLADCEKTLIDAKAEREQVKANKAAAEDRRTDPELTEAQAVDAHLEVEEASLRLIRLDRAIERLAEIIAAKKANAVQAEAQKRYDQARHRRDELATELVEHVAPLIDKLAAYLARIAENDRELAQINTNLPDACDPLVSAEVIARGPFARQYGAHQLVAMKLPLFAHNALAWPSKGDAKAAAAKAEQASARIAKANADREASKARYLISVGDCKASFPMAVTTEGNEAVRGTIDVWCYPNQVEINRQKGLAVEPWTANAASSVSAHRRAFEKAIT